MDNLKVLDMLHTYFGKTCGTEEKTQQERSTQYQSERKKWEDYLAWYELNRGKEVGKNPITLQSNYAPLVKDKAIPDEIYAILQDMNSRGLDPFYVRDMVEGFLFNVREGWGANLKKHIASFG